jgi:hypothetical protein
MKIEGIDITMHAKINPLKKHVGHCQAKKHGLGVPMGAYYIQFIAPT